MSQQLESFLRISSNSMDFDGFDIPPGPGLEKETMVQQFVIATGRLTYLLWPLGLWEISRGFHGCNVKVHMSPGEVDSWSPM